MKVQKENEIATWLVLFAFMILYLSYVLGSNLFLDVKVLVYGVFAIMAMTIIFSFCLLFVRPLKKET